tara:strand:+ start:11191 stop:11808 length:618 start_codon:yes stop_codon:yes gene_type:complete
MQSKICGIKDSYILNYIINHKYPPNYIGFICNFKKSKRYVGLEKLKKLLTINKKKTLFVAVLVSPKKSFLEKIKNIKFDYFQLYNVSPKDTLKIKKKYKKKVISALTIEKKEDVLHYKNYEKISDIILFDSKGYEKSMSFDHSFLKNIKLKKKIMIAGNIKHNDRLDNLKKIADIIDISGGLETFGKKDISKIDIFLNNIIKVNI